jgi:diguanylate cyclase (GGDEF)-like protein
VRGWPVWVLPPRLRGYVIAVIAAGAVAAGTAAAFTPWRAHDAILYGILLAIGAVTVESIRKVGEPALAGKDAHGIWELAIAILLPPFYALTAPIAVLALTQWRVRRTLAHRRAFSAAAVGLSYGAASLAFHLAWHHTGTQHRIAYWVLLATACAAMRWAINHALVVTAIKLDDPAARIRDLIGGSQATSYNDAAELIIGVLIAYCAVTSTLILIFVLPWAILLERSARRAQLVHSSRIDAKTGLLSGPAWQHEAAVQVARALRTSTPLAVAMIDIDHFKQVADSYGPVARDAVLLGVASTLAASIRETDIVGRCGGDEFTLLLPHADTAQALHIAELLQDRLSGIVIPAGPGSPGDPPHITTSIGLAPLTESITDLTDLLTAADSALYRAKRAGRNSIRLAGHPPPPRLAGAPSRLPGSWAAS